MDIPRKIKEAIDANKLVIFVGSGLSIKFGLPNWKKLACDIIENIDEKNFEPYIQLLKTETVSPIFVLDQLNQYHNEIKRYIKNNFQIKNEDADLKLHADLLELSGQIITSNYDNAFELASKNKLIPAIYTSLYNISEINKNNENYIFKLHGSYTEPDHCVVFSAQYEKLYSNESAAKEKLKSIFTDKTILFLGFSFNDPDINLIFKNLDNAFGNNNKHFILTKSADEFKSYNFLNCIKITDFNEIDVFIEDCLKYKKNTCLFQNTTSVEKLDIDNIPRIAILMPNPIDIDFNGALDHIIDCFSSIESKIFLGILNIKTLENIEDYDLLIIASKNYKSKLYIEDDNLKNNLMSPLEICSNIPNEEIPIVFITDEKTEEVKGYRTINISSLKNSIIKKFIYKFLKEKKSDFIEPEITFHNQIGLNKNFLSGKSIISSIYNTNRDLEFGKKCLSCVIGRIEEQSIIASKLISITKTNKLLNIKASGGTGKTTLIKKVSYELYIRGYYKEGVNFQSCENVKCYNDFEEILITGFNLANILDFKGYLIDNYSNYKIDLLLVLDNFETVVNLLNKDDLKKAIDLLKFATDYANIVVTSREKISYSDDFEDVYSLTPLITDDAFALFQNHYGIIEDEDEIRILREDILEDILNNNPLAIKLVTKSRTKSKHISELKEQLKKHFFESTNEDYSTVFNNNADLNIERTKSIFQSINYSYTTLSLKEKIAFELLSLFPDGISLTNFKKCFAKEKSKNNISDQELRNLRDKSLVEDYDGNLQLQPIIRRFADFQFNKRTNKEIKQKYCTDAYSFNCFILDIVDFIEKKKTKSESLNFFNVYKNNLLAVLDYIKDIEISEKSGIPEKKYLVNYITKLNKYLLSEKQINEIEEKINTLLDYFEDLPFAKTLLDVHNLHNTYFHKEFDKTYSSLNCLLSIDEMELRVFKNEDYLEERYKDIISNIHSMEGHTIQYVKSYINNDNTNTYLDSDFFYLGISDNISRKKDGFYYYEYELMFERLNVKKLEEYILSLYPEDHLEIMQSTYTLSKVKSLNTKDIQKLVVTNPYTRGLKELMFAFISESSEEKIRHFKEALKNLYHIKYYYLEALYYYCKYLKYYDNNKFIIKINEGLSMSNTFCYQYLSYLFKKLKEELNEKYVFNYSYYPIENLEEYVKMHNDSWEKYFKEKKLD